MRRSVTRPANKWFFCFEERPTWPERLSDWLSGFERRVLLFRVVAGDLRPDLGH